MTRPREGPDARSMSPSEAAAKKIADNTIEILRAERDRLFNTVEQQAAEIERLRAEMDNYGDDFVCQMKSKDARIKELESSLDEAEALTKKNADLMNSYLTRIAELEDALVEGLTNFLHYRASCYDPARRCPYAKECDDCSTWDACGHVEKFRSEARQRLQAEGKIGPDARPRSWQITEERNATLAAALKVLERLRKVNTDTDHSYLNRGIVVLRAMLTEAGQE